MVRGRFLKAIIKLNDLSCTSGFKCREQFEGLLEDAIDLGAKSMRRDVVPKLDGATVDVDDVIMA